MGKSGLLKGKTAIITGCNRGIGLAILDEFASQGTDVFAVIRKENADFANHCSEIEAEHSIRIKIFYADFSSDEEVKRAAKEILSEKTNIDVLVNNIGYADSTKSFMMEKMEDMRNVFQINFFSSFLFTQCLSRKLIRQKQGSVVFISSMAVYDAFANVAYTASKAAVVGMVRRLAVEFSSYGVRVNAVAPTLTDTDMGHVMGEEDEKEAVSRILLKRKAKPKEIADTVVYLASDMSSFTTGKVLRVDGGIL